MTMHKRRSKTRLAGNLEYNLAKGEGILKSIYSHRDKINLGKISGMMNRFKMDKGTK